MNQFKMVNIESGHKPQNTNSLLKSVFKVSFTKGVDYKNCHRELRTAGYYKKTVFKYSST